MKLLPQRVENENTYRNEMYLLNGFDLMASVGRPRVSDQIHQPDRDNMSKNSLLGPYYNTHHHTSTIHNSFKS